MRRYKRTPVEIPKPITVADLDESATTEIPLKDKVVLRVDRHDDPERGCRLIEIALCNDRETPRKIPVDAWLYQTKLTVDGGRSGRCSCRSATRCWTTGAEPDDELRRLNLQYRDRLEFAVGRTCSVDWAVRRRRAAGQQGVDDVAADVRDAAGRRRGDRRALLDMTRAGDGRPGASCGPGCRRSSSEYAAWLDGEETRAAAAAGAPARRGPGRGHRGAEGAAASSRTGSSTCSRDADALRCFRFMNEVMADQRVQSQVAGAARAAPGRVHRRGPRRGARRRTDRPHSWRTFQLAFILMQLPLLTDPAAAKRSGDLAKAQLLFFPTGGGKTEAYLGLAAYTFAIRRLQGVVDTAGRAARRARRGGRADAVHAAAADRAAVPAGDRAGVRRRAGAPARRGHVGRRSRSGSGCGSGPTCSPKRYEEAEEQLKRAAHGGRRLPADRAADPALPVVRHPDRRGATCSADAEQRRVYVYCGDELADCPFAAGRRASERACRSSPWTRRSTGSRPRS